MSVPGAPVALLKTFQPSGWTGSACQGRLGEWPLNFLRTMPAHSGQGLLVLSRVTEVAPPFYSLLESAKLAGVEPKLYLLTGARRAFADTKAVTLAHEIQH